MLRMKQRWASRSVRPNSLAGIQAQKRLYKYDGEYCTVLVRQAVSTLGNHASKAAFAGRTAFQRVLLLRELHSQRAKRRVAAAQKTTGPRERARKGARKRTGLRSGALPSLWNRTGSESFTDCDL